MIHKKPIIIVNFKAYKESIGQNAIHLAKICDKVAIETGTDIRIAVDAVDLHEVSKNVTIPVYAEHVDEYPLGKHTGSILPEMIKVAGARGTLLNHSEDKIALKKLEETIKRCKELSITVVACAENVDEEKQIISFSSKPEFIAIEPPELIGGDISVSTARPELISDASKAIHNSGIKLLVGAGVKTGQDVKIALELGADGVLLASGITLAKDPYYALKELLRY